MPLNITIVQKVGGKQTPESEEILYRYSVNPSSNKFVPIFTELPEPSSPTSSDIIEAVKDDSFILDELLKTP
jgi:hypothetical protein